MFEVGKEYNRKGEIHNIYGGQNQYGISTPAEYPVIFIFDYNKEEEYGYKNEYSDNGIFWYTGEGREGDMKMNKGNEALRAHKENNKTIHMFESTRDGSVRYMGEANCIGYHEGQRPDRNDKMRKAFIFHLDIDSTVGLAGRQEIDDYIPESEEELKKKSLSDLRIAALKKAKNLQTVKLIEKQTYYRSQAIKLYALKRSGGNCEACNNPAPFNTKSGPFLECHHLHRLSDGGPDHPYNVIALCRNCHRKSHYSIDARQFNKNLKSLVKVKEKRINR